MSVWFFINIIIFIFAIWKLSIGNVTIFSIIGGIGVTLILYNWTRNAVYATIRNTKERKRKIFFAKLAKKFIHIHKWTGSLALLMIIIHGIGMLFYYRFPFESMKVLSGLTALFFLTFLVIFGWLRFIRTTVARRYIHWSLAYVVVILLVFHLLF